MVTTTHSFVADYYENDSGADRKGSITFSNRPYGVTVTLGVRQSPVIPDTPAEPGIATGADLVAFAKAVNAGGSTSRWENASGEVVLLNDIDLSGLTEWTPIGAGKATGNTLVQYAGQSVLGRIQRPGPHDQRHSVDLRRRERDDPPPRPVRCAEGAPRSRTSSWAPQATKSTVTGASQNVVAVGALTGYAEGSTITAVTNNVSVILTGDNPDATLMMLAGIAGCAKSTVIGGETKTDAVVNNGDVKTGRITNTANGGTGMNVGGICAFTLGAGIKIDYCTNNGEVSAPTGRGGGLVGTLGGSTSEENWALRSATRSTTARCRDDAAGQYGGSRDYYNYKRMGGLVGGTVTNNNIRIEYCTNNGNVFSQLGCRTGGFVGQPGHDRRLREQAGTILANITYDAGAPQHGPGWACGYSAKGLVTHAPRAAASANGTPTRTTRAAPPKPRTTTPCVTATANISIRRRTTNA